MKKCCNNPANVPVAAPSHNLTQQQLRDLDKGDTLAAVGAQDTDLVLSARSRLSEGLLSGPPGL